MTWYSKKITGTVSYSELEKVKGEILARAGNRGRDLSERDFNINSSFPAQAVVVYPITTTDTQENYLYVLSFEGDITESSSSSNKTEFSLEVLATEESSLESECQALMGSLDKALTRVIPPNLKCTSRNS